MTYQHPSDALHQTLLYLCYNALSFSHKHHDLLYLYYCTAIRRWAGCQSETGGCEQLALFPFHQVEVRDRSHLTGLGKIKNSRFKWRHNLHLEISCCVHLKLRICVCIYDIFHSWLNTLPMLKCLQSTHNARYICILPLRVSGRILNCFLGALQLTAVQQALNIHNSS